MPNRLINSDSPYLLQHANNPVDWYEWSEEAFEKAKRENKLIFLSIGYSTCHWCHVMEKESFENKEIADILNRDYVSIKVDREEMSDIDKYFQKVYQLMHKRAGGWPLTIIMTPDKKPFYSATYIPPHYSQFGPGLKEILTAIATDFKNNPSKIKEIANNFERYFKENEFKELPKEKIDENLIEKIKKGLEDFDFENGGFKGAPKFPQESSLDLLIDVYTITKDEEVKKAINLTLTKMAKGGIFDQIEGGFYRYSTDAKWEIPHFEKMLYNNANIPFVYIRWYKITKEPLFKEVAFRSLDEFLKRYRDKKNLFFSASNADSEGVEGKYFVYEYDEVEEKFREFENKEELLNYFGIKKYGNFHGKNNPTINGKKPKNYEKALKILQEIRRTKEFPFIDTKKITAWNAMMIKALFKAGEIDEKYKNEAITTLESLIKIMYKDKLYHSFNKDENKKKEGLLEDYAFLISALIEAYTHIFEEKYLNLAKKLAKEVFSFKENNKWFMNKTHTILADFSDSSYSSSLSVLANDFLDLALLEFDIDFKQEAEKIIENGSFYINNYPLYYATITKAYLKSKKAFVIKANKPYFEAEIIYPYILFKKGEFEICTSDRCIKKGESISELLEEIQ